MAGIQVRIYWIYSVRLYPSLKSNHARPSMFQTFGIITSAFLCRTIREMQVDWNSWDGTRAQRKGRETNFQVSVEFSTFEIKRRIILMFHPFTFDDSAVEIFVRGNNDTYVIIITWIFRADFAKSRLHWNTTHFPFYRSILKN